MSGGESDLLNHKIKLEILGIGCLGEFHQAAAVRSTDQEFRGAIEVDIHRQQVAGAGLGEGVVVLNPLESTVLPLIHHSALADFLDR